MINEGVGRMRDEGGGNGVDRGGNGGGPGGGGMGRTGSGTGGNGGGNGCGRGGMGVDGGRTSASNFSSLYLYFVDMSSHMNILYSTCPEWGNVITHTIR